MEISEILRRVDHTLLSPTATWRQIQTLCDEAAQFSTASVCIPASYAARAAAYLEGRVPVCTVVGFPNGYDTAAAKAFESSDAVAAGVSEIDMVVDLGFVKDARWDDVLAEIREVRKACRGRVLKVIVETCLLTREEKIRLCGIVTESGADFIKTSTGFSTGGATFADVELFRQHVGKQVKIKAAGGISTLADAEKFISLGADRLGTSRLVRLAKEAGFSGTGPAAL